MATVMTAQRELHGYISEVSERADVQAGGYPVVVYQRSAARSSCSIFSVQAIGGKFGSASALRTFDCVAITSASSAYRGAVRSENSKSVPFSTHFRDPRT